MNISFDELRRVKHSLPTGSIGRIANELSVPEQTVRNYFGASKYGGGSPASRHIQPGPDGGIVHLEDTTILDFARRIIDESHNS